MDKSMALTIHVFMHEGGAELASLRNTNAFKTSKLD